MPDCYTPTKCFTALNAGADLLKIFPFNAGGISLLKSLSTVLPAATKICPTGGVTAEHIAELFAAGVFAIGIGAVHYQPGKTMQQLSADAAEFVKLVTAVG